MKFHENEAAKEERNQMMMEIVATSFSKFLLSMVGKACWERGSLAILLKNYTCTVLFAKNEIRPHFFHFITITSIWQSRPLHSNMIL